jgi:hypothetical protein
MKRYLYLAALAALLAAEAVMVLTGFVTAGAFAWAAWS